eukprot:362769-Chlamydomonas_euryale.AAC.3
MPRKSQLDSAEVTLVSVNYALCLVGLGLVKSEWYVSGNLRFGQHWLRVVATQTRPRTCGWTRRPPRQPPASFLTTNPGLCSPVSTSVHVAGAKGATSVGAKPPSGGEKGYVCRCEFSFRRRKALCLSVQSLLRRLKALRLSADQGGSKPNAKADQGRAKPNAKADQGRAKPNAKADQGGAKPNAKADKGGSKPNAKADQGGAKPNAKADQGGSKPNAKADQGGAKPNAKVDQGRAKPNAKADQGGANPNAKADQGRVKPNAKADQGGAKPNAKADKG